jgi:tRNA threonylcarbamoyladenosine biosynthesis protein TsaB
VTVLGIETATLVCGAAVAIDGSVVADEWVEARNVHAERLMALIDRALGIAEIRPDGLDGIAVSEGPGSFTGLRVGVSVAKGLAYATGKPLAGVPTLRAIAERAVRECARPVPEFVIPLLDARRGEVYYQLFRIENGVVVSLGGPEAGGSAWVGTMLAGRKAFITGEAAERLFEGGWRGGGNAILAEPGMRRCSAGMIALLGGEMVRAGLAVDPADLEPRYIKEFFLRAPQA